MVALMIECPLCRGQTASRDVQNRLSRQTSPLTHVGAFPVFLFILDRTHNHDESEYAARGRIGIRRDGYGISRLIVIVPFRQHGHFVISMPATSSISSLGFFFTRSGWGLLSPSSSLQSCIFSFLCRLARNPKCLIFMNPLGRT